MNVERIAIADLSFDPANARKHPERNLAAITASLRRFGQQTPIVIDKSNIVRKGNGTLQAAIAMGWDSIDCIRTELTSSDAIAYAIADNRTSELAEWDEDILAAQLQGLLTEDEALLEAAGFDEDELAAMLDELEGDGTTGEIVEDEVPEPPADPITKPGDLWILGRHRVLCGDSTKADDVARLMDGAKAAACITDPPYSVNYDKSHETRGGDAAVHAAYHEADIKPADLLCFMKYVPCEVMVWSYPIDRHFQSIADAYKQHGWEFKKELVWVKDSFSFWMSAKYQQMHEPIMLAVRKGKPIGGNIPANATTVFEYPRPRSHDLHPTMKPIELWTLLISYHSNKNDILYEPFCGSGTTLIAAEQLGRKCYGMEISPAYCDVIVKRWENLTGQKAVCQSATPA